MRRGGGSTGCSLFTLLCFLLKVIVVPQKGTKKFIESLFEIMSPPLFLKSLSF
jgi:hypothetical protein